MCLCRSVYSGVGELQGKAISAGMLTLLTCRYIYLNNNCIILNRLILSEALLAVVTFFVAFAPLLARLPLFFRYNHRWYCKHTHTHALTPVQINASNVYIFTTFSHRTFQWLHLRWHSMVAVRVCVHHCEAFVLCDAWTGIERERKKSIENEAFV